MAKAKILVVDDELDIVRAMTMRLRAAGYEVIAAHDGLMATQMAIQQAPDLVILDIGMPCGDGHTVAQRLQNNMDTMSTPVIFVSARTSHVDKAKAAAIRPAGYLTKPYQAEELLNTVERALKLGDFRTGAAYTTPCLSNDF